MRMKWICAAAVLTLAFGLTACEGQGTTSQESIAETDTSTEMLVTEAKDKEFVVEPNAIEGMKLVERILPLGSKYLLIGLNEYDGRTAALYDPKTKETTPKTLKRLSEAGDILNIVQEGKDRIHVFYALGEDGSERYMETYDSTMTLIDETAVEDMLVMDETMGDTVDYPTMEVDGKGNRYFFGFDISGNHQVMVFDKELQFLGSIRGDMTIGDELISAADGKVYLLYHGAAQQALFACVNPEKLTLDVIENSSVPAYYGSVVSGTNGYDFYLNAHEALYGIHAAEGTSEVVIDWYSNMFDGNEVRGIYANTDGTFLISNVGGNVMDPGTWKMSMKE